MQLQICGLTVHVIVISHGNFVSLDAAMHDFIDAAMYDFIEADARR